MTSILLTSFCLFLFSLNNLSSQSTFCLFEVLGSSKLSSFSLSN
ncbi:hypothetical protein A0H76_3067 [Hepatospora eriocheir]|uniref:Uncharacterized protein n=1 Tax=Hepatospora eriocheir TaxID=1081669 RepID=A0A1X0Q6D7_9MICR|nr:hypothetical protein A0H76_3067 [Hepatospora eriocheir]